MTIKYNVKDLELVNYKALVNLVAERTDYLVYEVEDVINGLREVIIEALENNVDVRIENLFTIKQRVFPSRELVHPISGEAYVSQAKLGVTIKASPELKRRLNPSEEFSDEVDNL